MYGTNAFDNYWLFWYHSCEFGYSLQKDWEVIEAITFFYNKTWIWRFQTYWLGKYLKFLDWRIKEWRAKVLNMNDITRMLHVQLWANHKSCYFWPRHNIYLCHQKICKLCASLVLTLLGFILGVLLLFNQCFMTSG